MVLNWTGCAGLYQECIYGKMIDFFKADRYNETRDELYNKASSGAGSWKKEMGL